jgi:hypothetical protein
MVTALAHRGFQVIGVDNLNEHKPGQADPGLKAATKAFDVGRGIPMAQRDQS